MTLPKGCCFKRKLLKCPLRWMYLSRPGVLGLKGRELRMQGLKPPLDCFIQILSILRMLFRHCQPLQMEKVGSCVPRSCWMLNRFPNKPWFLHVCSTSLLKTLWEKEKLLVTSISSFSRSVLYRFGELSAIFIKFEIVICKLFQLGSV